MQVSIWDLDWYHNREKMPNVQCMQLSSYCKQKGYNINFITKEEHIKLKSDKFYIFKEDEDSPMPPRTIIDQVNTKLIGEGFKYFKTIKLSSVIASCRPDYLLYELTGKYANSNFLRFYNGKELVKLRQDFHNTSNNKKFTIVVDKYFWNADEEDVIWCLNELKKERNIMFKHPISLRLLINNKQIQELFLQLKFCTGTEFKWVNDYSNTEIEPIIDFMLKLKKNTKSNIGRIPILTSASGNKDFDVFRCLSTIHTFKVNKIHCIIMADKKDGFELQLLNKWTEKDIQMSFVEYIVHFDVKQRGVLWYNILNNSMHWSNKKIDFLLHLLINYEQQNLKQLLYSQWGDETLSDIKVDYNYIRTNINLIYKELQDE